MAGIPSEARSRGELPARRRSPARVLVVEDEPQLASLYAAYLEREGITNPQLVDSGAAALSAAADKTYDVVLLDINLPDMNGLEVLRSLAGRVNGPTVIVITALGSINLAVEAMRAGAYDFLVKPFTAERFLVTLRNALERQRLASLVETFRDERDGYCGFLGSSQAMQAVYRIIDSAASSKATVFITGESGTGKELCAEAVHRMSPRRERPFIAINCAAIPKDLMESEIFGHVKGAFTGAISDHEGAAKRAHSGTLFLDEICDMDPNLQTKLLRFVQTGTFTPVGGSAAQRVDVRFVCATNKNPLAEVEAGRFREDLYYRLHVIPIEMPPLRERGDDVRKLAEAFLDAMAAEEGKTFEGLSEEAAALIQSHDWPGNIRQLQNVMRSVVVLNPGGVVTDTMLPQMLRRQPGRSIAASAKPMAPGSPAGEGEEVVPLWVIEKRAIEQAIAMCDGNIPKAAELLRISPSTIYRKRQAWAAGEEG
jgi:two-component system repressor protein LuxO